jgi:twinkle protein
MSPEQYVLNANKRRVVCPWCEHTRRTKGDRCLSLKPEHDKVLYQCWHCGVKGAIHRAGTAHKYTDSWDKTQPPLETEQVDTEQSEPTLRYLYIDPTPAALDWFQSRGISAQTVAAYGVMSSSFYSKKLKRQVEAVAFPYRNGYKLRAISVKDFVIDGTIDQLYVPPVVLEPGTEVRKPVVCEGELDAMSFYEAGIRAWSLPHGAINPSTKIADGKLDVLSSLGSDELKNGVVIACDADDPGLATSDEIARRYGKDISFLVDYPVGNKDANDILIKGGVPALRDFFNSAKPYPISGLWGVDHFESLVKDLYIKGLGKGLSTGYPCVDELYTIAPGQLTVVTGVPSSGKSEFVDQLMVNIASANNWRFAVASFENPPALHIAKLASKRERKPFFTGPTERLNELEFSRALKWVGDHFYFIHDEHGSTSDLQSILERLGSAVRRHGVRGVVIDPYNYISRPSADISETQWISDMLTKVCAFARAHDVHVWFVAHPAKMQRAQDGKIPVPKGYDISGSAAWFAKADAGLTVHRPDPYLSNEVHIHVWKMRFSWLGKQGEAHLNYIPSSYNYEELRPVNRNYGLSDDWDID